MKNGRVEQIIKNGVGVLSEIWPAGKHLYLPLLQAVAVWAMRRTEEWEKRILSLEIRPAPEAVRTKPDEFVLRFFESRPALESSYGADIKKKDMKSLRKAFSKLYPVIGLEDPFLQALFGPELDSGDYCRIVHEFDERVTSAKNDIKAMPVRSRLAEGLKNFGREIASLGLHLSSEAKIRRIIGDEVRKWREAEND